ncbi:MAG: CHAT domain-containing protein [Anaerolineaceae bacterium]
MSVEQASAQDAGLRIRLRLSETPELADLPWEYLYNAPLNRFLSLSTETPVVRYLDLPERVQPLCVELPIRVLVMVASPNDYPPLDVEVEWSKLKDALKDLEADGRVILERLPTATLQGLQRRLRRESCHVFHFIGHGGFSEQHADGLLVLEGNTGRADPVSSQYLGALLHDHRPLRVAVLNACEGARGGRTDPFAGTAQSLVQQGIPAVIAMQFEITDEAAVIFAHELYLSIADGCAIDTALGEARKALFSQVSEPEWGTPVLYMRASDGRIFDVTNAQKQQHPPIRAPDREARPAVPANSGSPSSPAKGSLTSPRVYISYSWDSVAHKQRVLELSNALRGDGIETHLDQYEVGPPSWKQWQRQQIDAGDFVLMVCTEEYRRWLENEPGRGAHTDGELIRERLAADPDHGWLVSLGFGIYRENRAAIPAFVGDADYYNVAHHDGYQRLLARLLGQPLVVAPPVSRPHARASGGQAAPEIGLTVLEQAKSPTNSGSEDPSPPTPSKVAMLNDEIRQAERDLETVRQTNAKTRDEISVREQEIKQRSLFFPLLLAFFGTLVFFGAIGVGIVELIGLRGEGIQFLVALFGATTSTVYVRAKIRRGYSAQLRRLHQESAKALENLEASEVAVRSKVASLRAKLPSP